MLDNPALWWLGMGFALLIVEMLTGTLFCLWLSAAAFGTAALAWLLAPGLAVEMLVFAVLAVASLFAWRYFRPRKIERHEAAAGLNNRAASCIGREVVLVEPIVQGRGRVNIDDTWWLVRGDDAPAGSQVRVDAVEGMVLLVKRSDA